jgi:hypothetical protein
MKLRSRWVIIVIVLYSTFALHLLTPVSVAQSSKIPQRSDTTPRGDASAASAFLAIVPVLRHPRCMNCHSKGDFPRQGDDSHPHTMNVRRGFEGNGVAGVKCNTCHQEHNLAGVHMPPGAPDWHLPPPNMPMIWEGLSDRQLCELFKDAKQNGGRTVNEIVEHMQTPLVRWGWHPGDGRSAVSVPFDQFLSNVKTWAGKGAACPADEPRARPRSSIK